MRRLLFLGVVAAGLLVAATANAKGPVAAAIDGPGTGGRISIGGNGEPGSGAPLGNFAQAAGLFPALFEPTPDPMLDERPSGYLGPRYTVTYRLPGPNGSSDEIRQDLYPYAKNGPVTYTPPGQRFFETRKTRGGWYQSAPSFKGALVRAGLPETPPALPDSGGDGLSRGDLWLPAAAVFAALLGAIGIVLVRRRPRIAGT